MIMNMTPHWVVIWAENKFTYFEDHINNKSYFVNFYAILWYNVRHEEDETNK